MRPPSSALTLLAGFRPEAAVGERGSMVLDIAPAGFVSRVEGADGDSTVVLLMDARLDRVPDSQTFDPGVEWDPGI